MNTYILRKPADPRLTAQGLQPVEPDATRDGGKSSAEDVEFTLDAAHKARSAWGCTVPAERARLLNLIADRIQANLGLLANVETVDNGKPICGALNADVPLADAPDGNRVQGVEGQENVAYCIGHRYRTSIMQW